MCPPVAWLYKGHWDGSLRHRRHHWKQSLIKWKVTTINCSSRNFIHKTFWLRLDMSSQVCQGAVCVAIIGRSQSLRFCCFGKLQQVGLWQWHWWWWWWWWKRWFWCLFVCFHCCDLATGLGSGLPRRASCCSSPYNSRGSILFSLSCGLNKKAIFSYSLWLIN